MDGYRYGSMCWHCRGFYWRVHLCSGCGAYLCNYCRIRCRVAERVSGFSGRSFGLRRGLPLI